jgi:hypothetical protein
MLAYYLQWHMCLSLALMLFDEPDPAAREAQRITRPRPSSPAARRKAACKWPEPVDGELPPAQLPHAVGDLTLTRNVVRLGATPHRHPATLTPTQRSCALDLLGVTPTA